MKHITLFLLSITLLGCAPRQPRTQLEYMRSLPPSQQAAYYEQNKSMIDLEIQERQMEAAESQRIQGIARNAREAVKPIPLTLPDYYRN